MARAGSLLIPSARRDNSYRRRAYIQTPLREDHACFDVAGEDIFSTSVLNEAIDQYSANYVHHADRGRFLLGSAD